MCYENNPSRQSLSDGPALPEPNGHDSFAESVNPDDLDALDGDGDDLDDDYDEPDFDELDFGLNLDDDDDELDFDDDDDDDYDTGMSYDQQRAADLSDYAGEQLRAGRIDAIQAAEIRFGA